MALEKAQTGVAAVPGKPGRACDRNGVAALLDNSFLENNNVSIIYTLAVVIIASITPGYIYGIIGSIISVIGVNYFFASPRFAFNFTQTGYPITFASLLVVSIIMSTLMTRYREAAHIARMRETRTKTLYELTNEFLAADDAESFVQIACEYLSRVCGTKTCYAPEGTELPKDVPVCISLPVAVRENRVWHGVCAKGRLCRDREREPVCADADDFSASCACTGTQPADPGAPRRSAAGKSGGNARESAARSFPRPAHAAHEHPGRKRDAPGKRGAAGRGNLLSARG